MAGGLGSGLSGLDRVDGSRRGPTGEWILNRQSFVATREPATEVQILAAVIGVAFVTACHLIAVGIAGILYRPKGSARRSTHANSCVGYRSGFARRHPRGLGDPQWYFASHGARLPAFALLTLQAFLAIVAVMTSLAHQHPLHRERARSQRQVEDAQDELERHVIDSRQPR